MKVKSSFVSKKEALKKAKMDMSMTDKTIYLDVSKIDPEAAGEFIGFSLEPDETVFKRSLLSSRERQEAAQIQVGSIVQSALAGRLRTDQILFHGSSEIFEFLGITEDELNDLAETVIRVQGAAGPADDEDEARKEKESIVEWAETYTKVVEMAHAYPLLGFFSGLWEMTGDPMAFVRTSEASEAGITRVSDINPDTAPSLFSKQDGVGLLEVVHVYGSGVCNLVLDQIRNMVPTTAELKKRKRPKKRAKSTSSKGSGDGASGQGGRRQKAKQT